MKVKWAVKAGDPLRMQRHLRTQAEEMTPVAAAKGDQRDRGAGCWSGEGTSPVGDAPELALCVAEYSARGGVAQDQAPAHHPPKEATRGAKYDAGIIGVAGTFPTSARLPSARNLSTGEGNLIARAKFRWEESASITQRQRDSLRSLTGPAHDGFQHQAEPESARYAGTKLTRHLQRQSLLQRQFAALPILS